MEEKRQRKKQLSFTKVLQTLSSEKSLVLTLHAHSILIRSIDHQVPNPSNSQRSQEDNITHFVVIAFYPFVNFDLLTFAEFLSNALFKINNNNNRKMNFWNVKKFKCLVIGVCFGVMYIEQKTNGNFIFLQPLTYSIKEGNGKARPHTRGKLNF